MKKTHRGFTFCLLALLSAGSSLSAQPTGTNGFVDLAEFPAAGALADAGDQLLLHIVQQLENRPNISANVQQRASLNGWLMEGGGRYLQQIDTGRQKIRVRFDLRAQIEGRQVRLLQVSDGDRLWTDQRTPQGHHVTSVDLRRLRRNLQLAFAELPAGQARGLPLQLELSVEQGGLPALIAGLRENFSFSPPVSLWLGQTEVEGTMGFWKMEKLAHYLKRSEHKESTTPANTSPCGSPCEYDSTDSLPPSGECFAGCRGRGPISLYHRVSARGGLGQVFRERTNTAPITVKSAHVVEIL